MNLLRWIEHHPILTVILLLTISVGIAHVIRAIRGDDSLE